jgi:hypothetical protein
MSPFLRNMRMPRQGSAAGTQAFLEAIQPRPMGPRVGALPPQLAGPPMRQTTPPFPLRAGMAGAAMRPRPTASAMTPLQRDIMTKMSYGGMTPAAPKTPASGIMGRLPSVGTPAFAGLGQAAATGLQLSGYRDRPITTGEGLGAMMSAGLKAYTEAKRANLADQIALAKLGEKSDFEKRLELAGIDPKSSEGQKMIREMLTKADTVFMGGDKQKEEAYKAALAARKEMLAQVNKDRELGVRLDQAIDLLQGGAPTGRLQSAMLPLKQLAREFNVLSDDQIADLTNQEIIDNVASYLVPRMRVVGSGASSDRDMDFFARATIRMANTPQANLVIAKMQKQLMDFNKKRLNLFEQYVKKQGDDFGFAEFADQEMGNFYERAMTDQQFNQLIDDGLLKEGDVFYNGKTNEFDILTEDMM